MRKGGGRRKIIEYMRFQEVWARAAETVLIAGALFALFFFLVHCGNRFYRGKLQIWAVLEA